MVAEPADIVIRGGRVYTVDDAQPWGEAVAIRGDRISWVGDEVEAEEHIGPDTQVIEGNGGSILPGIIDSHNHVRVGGSADNSLDLHGAATLAEVHERIAAWLREHPDATWIEAHGLSYEAIPGGGMPSSEHFDERITDGRPAIVLTYDAHNAVLNRSGLTWFGITRDTEQVPFGIVEKDPTTGEPTGLIGRFAVMGIERAGHAALAAVLPGYSPESQYQALIRNLDLAISLGITTIVEPQNSLDDLQLFARARDEGRLGPRLVAALFHPPWTSDEDLDAFAVASRTYTDDRFRVGPVKLYIDDVVEPHTAAFFEPYATEPMTLGDTFYGPDAFRDLIAKLDARGFQTFTHAMGDRGIRIVLDAHEHARAVNGVRDIRHQLVHVECPHPDDVPRFAELGLVACMQPRHWGPDIAEVWREAVGPERERWAAPFRSLAENGVILAFSSDWDVAEMDPFVGIYSALTRADLRGENAWGVEQTVDLPTAIRAYTMGGAFANHCDADRGSITPGKYADLIVLSEDLFGLEPTAILETQVVTTIVGGEVQFRAA
ncbi:MAG: amidohydrolase [Actinomycetota bacterium]